MTNINCSYANLLASIVGKDADQIKRQLDLPTGERYCLQCGEPTHKKFCSPECQHKFYYIEVSCSQCGKLFEKRATELIWKVNHTQSSNNKPQQLCFCSPKCLGKWGGINYGFAAHPENSCHPKKWDYDKVYKLREETGWGATKISQALGIPEPTVTHILRKLSFK